MAQYGFFQYLRLKIIVVLLRAYVRVTSNNKLQRDRQLIPSDAAQERIKIPSREPGRYILADLYFPPGYEPSVSSPLPILVNWHGSGFIFPLLGTDALFCARIAHETGIIVLDADYRKGPENPYPAALHDVEDALRWVATQDHRFDRTRLGVSGFSAGGNLALVAATALRRKLEKFVDIRVSLSTYAIYDLAAPPESKKAPHPINPHPVWALHLFNDCYAPDVDSRSDPAISPAFADPIDFPPTVALISCEGDQLWPEANALAERLKAANAPIKIVNRILEGVPHAFDKGAEEGTVAWTRREEAYALMAQLLKESFDL